MESRLRNTKAGSGFTATSGASHNVANFVDRIYSAPATAPARIYKISLDAAQLHREFVLQKRIGTVFHNIAQDYMSKRGQQLPLPYVPLCFDYFPAIRSSCIADVFQSHRQLPQNSGAYSMEYIQLLNRHHVKYLVKRHLSPSVQGHALQRAKSTHNLSRLCMGGLKPVSDSISSGMHDRLTYLDRLSKEHVDIYQLASVMGTALAILHWVCEIDAAGVQFMLGCDRRGSIQLWLIDFAKCTPFARTAHTASTQLVDAITDNGCVWPKWIDLEPFRDVWKRFKSAYVRMSLQVFTQEDEPSPRGNLPILFIQALAKMRGVKAASNASFSNL